MTLNLRSSMQRMDRLMAFFAARSFTVATQLLIDYASLKRPAIDGIRDLGCATLHSTDSIAVRAAWALSETIREKLQNKELSIGEIRSQIKFVRRCYRLCVPKAGKTFLMIALVRLGCKRACKQIVNDLPRSDGIQRMAILSSLGSIRTRAAHRALIRICKNEFWKSEQLSAATYLVFQACPIGLRFLRRNLSSPDAVSRCRAFFAIAWAGHADGVEGIRQIAANENDASVLRLLDKLISAYGEQSRKGCDALKSIQTILERRGISKV